MAKHKNLFSQNKIAPANNTRSFNISDKDEIKQYLNRKKTINDPYRCSPKV